MGETRSSLCMELNISEEIKDSSHLPHSLAADLAINMVHEATEKPVDHGTTTLCPDTFVLAARGGSHYSTLQTTTDNSGVTLGAPLIVTQSQNITETTSQVLPIDNCHPDQQHAASEEAISIQRALSSKSVPSSSSSYSSVADKHKMLLTNESVVAEPKLVTTIEGDERLRSDRKFASKSVVGYQLATECSDDLKTKRRKRVAVKTVIREVASNGYEHEEDARPNKKRAEMKVFNRESRVVKDTAQVIANQVVNGHTDEGMPKPKKSTKKKDSKSKGQGEYIASPTEGANQTKAPPKDKLRKEPKSQTKAPPEAELPKEPKSSPTSAKSGRHPAREVYVGPPTEPLEGGWPPGWIKQIVERQNGASAGHTDRYWYSPQTNKKFRSMVEIKRFLAHLSECGGDEGAAWIRFKAK